MTTPTATSRALAITEILEHILIQLPPQDILLAQGISKSVNALIAASPALQAALGFRTSSGATGTTTCSEETEVACTINPIISSAFPFLLAPYRTIPEDEIEEWKQRFGLQDRSPADAEKSLWDHSVGVSLRDGPFGMSLWDHPVGVNECPPREASHQKFWYSQWLFNPAAWSREEASWRRMRVTKEPLRRLVLLQRRFRMRSLEISECILLLGEHGQLPETTDTALEARQKLKVKLTRQNNNTRSDESEPEEIPRRGWIKINDQQVDLTRWDGLPMSFVHDYLSGLVCYQEESPNFHVSFHSFYPPRPDPLVVKRLHYEDIVPEGMVERDGIGDGATMLIQTTLRHTCTSRRGPKYSRLCSLGAGAIKTGPWVSTRTGV